MIQLQLRREQRAVVQRNQRFARKAVLLPHWLCTPETAAQLDAV